LKIDELKKYDGKDGRSAYIAFKGNIYDVTGSKLWKNGSHINRHFAGEDLTPQMSVAPHAEDVMSRFKLVDTLETEDIDPEIDKLDKHRDWYRKYHPHPVFIHFPMGLFFFTTFMQALFLLFKYSPYESAAYYSLFIGVLGSYPATASGIYSWWINYQRLLTRTFKIKLYLSIILLLLTSATLLIRILIPDIAFTYGTGFFIYNILLFMSFPIVTAIGYFGGKITWPG